MDAKQPNMNAWIRELRKLTGLTQREFAAELGISYSTVNRWENGHKSPSAIALAQLEQFLYRLSQGDTTTRQEQINALLTEQFGKTRPPMVCQSHREDAMQIELEQLRRENAQLKASHQLQQRFFDLSLDVFAIVDFQGRWKQISPSWTLITGFTEAEMLERSLFEWMHPDDRSRCQATFVKLIHNPSLDYAESRYRCKDGSYRWFSWSGIAFAEEQLVYGVGRDITQQKETEHNLLQVKKRHQHLINSGNHWLLVHGLTDDGQLSQFTELNQAACQALGYTKEELLQQSPITLTAPHCLADVPGYLSQLLEQKHVLFELETVTKTGEYIPVEIDTYLCEEGNDRTIFSFLRDISDRKQAERELQQREQAFRILAENAPDPISRLDRDLRYLYVNPAAQAVTGIPQHLFLGKTIEELGFPVDQVDQWTIALKQIFATGQPTVIEANIPSPKGDIRYYQSCCVPEFAADGSVNSVLTIARDMTEFKHAEQVLQVYNQELERQVEERTQALLQFQEALRQSEELFRKVFDESPIGLGLVDLTGRFVRTNTAMSQTFGYTEAEFIGLPLSAINFPEDLAADWQQVQELLKGNLSSFQLEKRYICKDCTVGWVKVKVTLIRDAEGKPLYCLGANEDITETKRLEAIRQEAEAALKASEARFQKLAAHVPGMIYQYVLQPDGSDAFFYASPACSKLLEVEPERLYRDLTILWDMVHPDDLSSMQESIAQSAQTLTPWTLEFRIITPSGRLKWMQGISHPERRANGDVVWDGILIDVSDRKQAETKLLSQAQMLDSASDTIMIRDLEDRITYWNQGAERLYGWTKAEAIDQPVHLLLNTIFPQPLTEIHAIFKQQGYWQGELIHTRRDGSTITVDSRWTLRRDVAGNIIDHLEISHDISERKQAEEQLKASLEEKNVLLKEIHHRVKNNLQTISSLLKLQLRTIEDPKFSDLFRESQNRVQAMALVHEKLYQSPNLARVNFADYASNLAIDLVQSYAVSPRSVQLKLNIEPLDLDADTIIPCGLILNELVSNSLKHAFPNPRSGIIQICFELDQDNQYWLTVQDDGIGLPAAIDTRQSPSLGLKLVNSLTRQLRGTVEVDRAIGTTFRVKFPQAEH